MHLIQIQRLLTKKITDFIHLHKLLWRDITEGNRNPYRLIDQIESIVSVFLAIAIAHAFELHHVGWAAFSGYMVMRNHIRATLIRGILRVLGSVIGAFLAFAVVFVFQHNLYIYSLSLLLITVISLYFSQLSTRGYAWLFLTLTFGMVLLDSLYHETTDVRLFAVSRVMEVSTGTLCCIFVSLISTYFVRKRILGKDYYRHPATNSRLKESWNEKAAINALVAGLAAASIPIVWYFAGLKGLGQSHITIVVTMTVPYAVMHTLKATSEKIRHRLIGCISGGLYATIILTIGAGNPYIIYPAIGIAIFFGRHIENGRIHINYIGTQFCLATLIVLAPDSLEHITISSAWSRLSGIFIGMLILEPVRYLKAAVFVLAHKNA